MKRNIVKYTLDLWNEGVRLPNLLNNSAIHNYYDEEFNHVGKDVPDFMNCLMYSLMKYITVKVKQHHGDKKITPDKIRDALLDDDVITIAFGNITIIHESEEVSVERVVQEVMSHLALSNIDGIIKNDLTIAKKDDKVVTKRKDEDYKKILENADMGELDDKKERAKRPSKVVGSDGETEPDREDGDTEEP